MNNCTNCGHQSDSGMFFCDNCGARIDQHTPPPTPPAPPTPPIPPTQQHEQQHEQQREGAQGFSGKIENESEKAPPQPQYPPAHGYPPLYPPPAKKSRTGLVIGIIFGSVALIVIIIIAALIYDSINSVGYVPPRVSDTTSPAPAPVSPAPPSPIPAPSPSNEPPPPSEPEPPAPPPPARFFDLVGIWERQAGDWIYFFGQSEYIIFNYLWDGLVDVVVSDYDNGGTLYIENSPYMIIFDEWDDTYEFLFILDGDHTITAVIDGDVINYFQDGQYMIIFDERDNIYVFWFILDRDVLTIMDVDGDAAAYIRIE